MAANSRLQNLQALLAKNKIDCAVVIPGPNLYYLTGLKMHLSKRVTCGFIPAQGKPLFVLPALEKPSAERTIKVEAKFFSYLDGQGMTSAFEQVLNELKLGNKKICVEYETMRLLEFRELERYLPGVSFQRLEDTLGQLRIIKDADEIALMKKAIQITEAVLQTTIDALRPGMTESEVARFFQREALEQPIDGFSFAPIVVAGPNGGSPHAAPGERAISKGDLVTIDCGVFYKGYPGDITRNVAMGTIDPELEKIHQVLEEANAAGRAACKPGVAAGEIDRITRDVIVSAGYGEYFIHRTGHGLGLEIHEPPFIMPENMQLLQPGMTFTIEPGIYMPQKGGARVEDDMLITAKGVETLTKFPRELIRK